MILHKISSAPPAPSALNNPPFGHHWWYLWNHDKDHTWWFLSLECIICKKKQITWSSRWHHEVRSVMATGSRTPIFAFESATPSWINHRSSRPPSAILWIVVQVLKPNLEQIPELLCCLQSQVTLTRKKGTNIVKGISKYINYSRIWLVMKFFP